jgi:hypothetical protein
MVSALHVEGCFREADREEVVQAILQMSAMVFALSSV